PVPSVSERIRRVVNNQIWTYVHRENVSSFTDTVTWCKSLGGKLPSIHSQEDIDWIAKAVGRTSSMSQDVWLGMRRKLVNEGCQLEWIDGTPYDYQFSWYQPCETDANIDAAMLMWLDRDFPKVFPTTVTNALRSVCVLNRYPVPSVPEQIHGMK